MSLKAQRTVVGASFRPKMKDNMVKQMQMTANDWAKLSITNATMIGNVTNIIILRRPIASQNIPLIKLPAGCATYARLAAIYSID